MMPEASHFVSKVWDRPTYPFILLSQFAAGILLQPFG